MKKLYIYILCLFLLTGCWDQKFLKEARLSYGSGFDLTNDGNILTTTVIRKNEVSGEGQGKSRNEIIVVEGTTLRETRMKIDNKLAGNFDPSKNRIYLFGKALAKKDIYSVLDVFYRTGGSALDSKIAVVGGTATEILQLRRNEIPLISEHILELIKSVENKTVVPAHTLHSIRPKMFDPGQDFCLPYLTRDVRDKNNVKVSGIALFNGHKFTGTILTPQESTLYLLLSNQKRKKARYVIENVKHDNKEAFKTTIVIQIQNIKNNKMVSVNNGTIKVNLDMTLTVNVNEYPPNNLYDKEKVKKLNKKISKRMTEDARNLVKKIQNANSDLFGIGRDLIAFHHDTWEKLNWKEKYPKIEITPSVKVKIISSGVIY